VREYGVERVATCERTMHPEEVPRVRVPEDWAAARGRTSADKAKKGNMIENEVVVSCKERGLEGTLKTIGGSQA